MTDLEQIREELKKRGVKTNVANSKALAIMLDVVLETGHTYTDLKEAELELAKLKREAHYKKCEAKYEIERLEKAKSKVVKEFDEMKEYIDRFFAKLAEGETPEGRDALRKAQLYVNACDVQTKYDNTAYIIGLAAILSNGDICAIDELKKINRDLFENSPTFGYKALRKRY